MTYLVEQDHDTFPSTSYRAAKEALTSKLETEEDKQLPR